MSDQILTYDMASLVHSKTATGLKNAVKAGLKLAQTFIWRVSSQYLIEPR